MSKLKLEEIRQLYHDIVEDQKYSSVKLSKETFIALVDKAELGYRGDLYTYEELCYKVIEYQQLYQVERCKLSECRADIKYLIKVFDGFFNYNDTIDINFDYWKKRYNVNDDI